MPTAAQQTCIDRLRAFPAQLEALVGTMNDEQLNSRIALEEWSIRQVAHHLADAHMIAVTRLKYALTEERSELRLWSQPGWASFADSQLPVAPALSILYGIHERLCAMLEGLTEDQWQRVAIHPLAGAVSLEKIAFGYASHCDEHIAQINAIRAANGF